MIPHLKYIEALVFAGWSPEKVEQHFLEKGLPFPEKHVAVIYSTIRSSYPDFFPPLQLSPDIDLLKDLGILEAYAFIRELQVDGVNPKHMEGAYGILDDPTMHRLVTSLAIAKLEDEDIELLANGKFNITFTVEDIKLFLKYFFNLSTWSHKQRKAWVESILDKSYRQYYDIALTGEKEYLMWKLGVNPEVPFSSMLNEMKNDSFFNFKESAKLDSLSAQRWAAVVLKISDKMDKVAREERGEGNPLDDILFTIKVSNGSKLKIGGEADQDDLGMDFKHFSDL
jgi:hypothetical protein